MSVTHKINLTQKEALELRTVLNEIPSPKKIQHQKLLRKLIGTKGIFSVDVSNEKGILPLPEAKPNKTWRQEKVIEGQNFLVQNIFSKAKDQKDFFQDEDVKLVRSNQDMIDILVMAGIFPSRGQARKNGWKGKEEIPKGFTELTVGKKKHQLFIFNPTADNVRENAEDKVAKFIAAIGDDRAGDTMSGCLSIPSNCTFPQLKKMICSQGTSVHWNKMLLFTEDDFNKFMCHKTPVNNKRSDFHRLSLEWVE